MIADFTRRDFGRLALAGASAPALSAKPNSNFGGVQIGAITYSFRALPSSAEEVLKYCVDCGISAVELMSNVAESYAGAPIPAGRGFFGGPPPGGAPGRGPGGGAGAGAAPGGGRGPGGRPPLTPEQQAAMKEAAEKLKQWRLSASMDKYKAFRRLYEDAGVKIYAFKLPPTMSMSDQEYDYIWNVAATLGADHITMELPNDDALLQRVAEFAAKRKLRIAFHTHGQGGSSGFEKALNASPYTALNLDVGHYFGVTGESPVPVIEKYHARISSLHLKDRKAPENGTAGANVPWGQGGTPIREILQTMKRRRYTFPASIEYEYNTPEGSDVLTEMKKCVQFCRDALAQQS
jgi:sugar phosphate isomerase/epimerase